VEFTKTWGYPDPIGEGDPYFKITLYAYTKDGKPAFQSQWSRSFGESWHLLNPFSATFRYPLDQPYGSVSICVEAWDDDGGWSNDDRYDISSDPGSIDWCTQYDVLSGYYSRTEDGAWDGQLGGAQAMITVEVWTAWALP
jgi:hypothetical protein